MLAQRAGWCLRPARRALTSTGLVQARALESSLAAVSGMRGCAACPVDELTTSQQTEYKPEVVAAKWQSAVTDSTVSGS